MVPALGNVANPLSGADQTKREQRVDRAVLKWPVAVDDRPHKIGGGQVVHVANQYDDEINVVTIWTIEPRYGSVLPKRTVQVYGTGQPLPIFATHLGSVVVAGGHLVWHAFELPRVLDGSPVTVPEQGSERP